MHSVSKFGKNKYLVLHRHIETFNWEAVDQKKPAPGKYYEED